MVSFLLPVSLLLAVLLLIPELFGDFMAYQIGLYLIYGIAAQASGIFGEKLAFYRLGSRFSLG